ncbi:MAG: hypothetical protein COB66_04495 [Coxiella sp. (in: Bacteria)]|nr:MAG: hypothetical protein COB66_04495 [Coxiella sp. (in: g-proteobacteria)]
MNLKPTYCLVVFSLLVVMTAIAKPSVHTPKNVIVKGPVTITVSGIKNTSMLQNIERQIKAMSAAHLVKPIDKNAILTVYSNAPMGIKKAMQPYGYFRPTLKSTYSKQHDIWRMHFAITQGVHSKITRVTIKVIGQGAHTDDFSKSIKSYVSIEGHLFILSAYDDGNESLLKNAAQLGYFDAKIVVKHMNINLLNNTVQINIVFNTGDRHRFGRTEFSKTPFNQKFLQKYIAYRQGQYYNNTLADKTQNNFSSSDYFTHISVAPDLKKSVGAITPMRVTLKMRKRSVYSFGLGYNTDTQIRGLAGFKYRWVNSWGHYFNARMEGSFVDYNLGMAYHIPWPNPMKDLLSFRAGMGKLDLNRGKSKSYLLSVLYKHSYTHWDHTLSLNYLNERYNMTNLPRTRANLIYPDLRIRYFSTKNRINPDTGLSFIADLSGTPAFLSSKSGYTRFSLTSKGVLSFLTNEQLVGRLSYGHIDINDINSLPLSLQFLIGGSQTVRGYSYQSIGPGRNMLYGTVELRQRLWKQLYLGGFYDFGNVTDGHIFSNMSDSAGPSILYRSPIGIIELSLPWRLASRHSSPRVVFSMGPEL